MKVGLELGVIRLFVLVNLNNVTEEVYVMELLSDQFVKTVLQVL